MSWRGALRNEEEEHIITCFGFVRWVILLMECNGISMSKSVVQHTP